MTLRLIGTNSERWQYEMQEAANCGGLPVGSKRGSANNWTLAAVNEDAIFFPIVCNFEQSGTGT
jgi:hypothetical protein